MSKKTVVTSNTDTYAMGRTQHETQRLQMQAQFLNPLTRRLFEQAGIRPGMKVLDIGSGAGDVVLLLADMVGPHGHVTGVDQNSAILEVAQARTQKAGLSNVTFLSGELETIQLDGTFDAIVGRLILMYLRSPVSVLRRLANHLRSGGLMAFLELDLALTITEPSHPFCPLWDQANRWIYEAFRQRGVPVRMGLEMYTIFLDAGLSAQQMTAEAMVGAGTDWIGYDFLADTVRSLYPLILKSGISTAEEIAIDTLYQRLRAEALDKRAVEQAAMFVSAWAVKAASSS